jgi:hypothetical protein
VLRLCHPFIKERKKKMEHVSNFYREFQFLGILLTFYSIILHLERLVIVEVLHSAITVCVTKLLFPLKSSDYTHCRPACFPKEQILKV